MNMINKKIIYFIAILISIIILFLENILAIPTGANVTNLNNQTSPTDPAAAVSAIAGNVSELNIYGYSTTQSWQGYYGNITGSIKLADSNNKVMYNWSNTSPKGEIFATNNSLVSWTNIECFNFSATGTFASDTSQRGGTSFYGMNLTQLETSYNISSNDVDGINETFNQFGAGGHQMFYTNHLQFSNGECRSTRIFSDAGSGEANKFEEALLYDPDSRSVVFYINYKFRSFGF